MGPSLKEVTDIKRVHEPCIQSTKMMVASYSPREGSSSSCMQHGLITLLEADYLCVPKIQLEDRKRSKQPAECWFHQFLLRLPHRPAYNSQSPHIRTFLVPIVSANLKLLRKHTSLPSFELDIHMDNLGASFIQHRDCLNLKLHSCMKEGYKWEGEWRAYMSG